MSIKSVLKGFAALIGLTIVFAGLIAAYVEAPSQQYADIRLDADSTHVVDAYEDYLTDGNTVTLFTTHVDVYGTSADDTITVSLVAYLHGIAFTIFTHEYAGVLVDTVLFDTLDEPYRSLADSIVATIDAGSQGTFGMDSVDLELRKREY